MSKALNVKFMGDDIQKLLDDVSRKVFAEKTGQANAIINAGLKESAQEILPEVWNRQRSKTGTMRMFTGLKRLKRGGWSIMSPYREELALVYPNARKAKGYYPASMEYGFKLKGKGKFVPGDNAMFSALNENKSVAIDVAKRYISTKLESALKRYIKKIDNSGAFNMQHDRGKIDAITR